MANRAWEAALEPFEQKEVQHVRFPLTDVDVGLVTSKLRGVAASKVHDTRSILPLQRELQRVDLAASTEGARRPEQGRNGPEGGHCERRINEGLEGKNGTTMIHGKGLEVEDGMSRRHDISFRSEICRTVWRRNFSVARWQATGGGSPVPQTPATAPGFFGNHIPDYLVNCSHVYIHVTVLKNLSHQCPLIKVIRGPMT